MQKKMMLIVDDNMVNQGLLTSIFEDDYIIKTANDGRAALAQLSYYGAKTAIVLLDLVMPGMDGFAVLEKMQENPAMRSIPVIVVSAQTEDENGLKAIRCGAADFVTKPVDPALIRIRVEAAVSRADNAQLRAENAYFLLQSSEEAKYRTVTESTGTIVVEYDRLAGTYRYDPSISRYLAGKYDGRKLWHIFMTDGVADVMDVKAMQGMVFQVGNHTGQGENSLTVKLKTPAGHKQWFRMRVFMQPGQTEHADTMILTFNNVNDEVENHEKLRFQAERDDLTGLYNRATFFEKAAEMIAAQEPGYYMMACFDIDNFKVINDQYGSEKGDAVLRHIADIFQEGLTLANGLVGRVMADHFAMLYPASFADSALFAQMQNAASVLDGSIHPISFSIGRYHVNDLSLPASAMYDRAVLAKSTIKGRYDVHIALYTEAMRDRLIHEQEIVNEMIPALESGQFEVWLQPQVNHATKAHIGAEALVRWRHPRKGIVSPGEFIPVFERNGFVYELDKYVWEQTCKLLHGWREAGYEPLPVSVNISRHDLFHEDLIETITGLIARYGIPAALLRLEITESVLAESTQQVVRIVKDLIDHGFMVEIDDFGNGYSSLNTIKDVPAQVLKMDMRFLENGEDAERGGNVLESVVRMARWLGMAVIAEGVETTEQADYLKSIGCIYVQGYLYAKPMPPSEYEKLVWDKGKEEKLLTLQTVSNLDNNAFWDPASMDTLIFNSFVGAACIMESSGGHVELVRVSDMFIQMLGSHSMTTTDALQLDWERHLAEESLAAMLSAVQRSIGTGENVTGEYLFSHLPGCPEKTYLRITLRVIASTGNSHLVYCLNENITAQKELEEKERASAEQLQAIMGNINGGVNIAVIRDGVPQVQFANEQYYSMRGYTQAQYEAEVSHLNKIIHPEDREMMFHATSTADTPFSIVYRIVRRDGAVRWVLNNVTFVRLPGYDELVQLSVTNDITELRLAERKELEISERLQAILGALNSGVSGVVYSDGNIEYAFANDMYYAMLGYTKEQFEAEVNNGLDLIHPDDRARIDAELAALIQSGDSAVFEYRVIKRDGEIAYLRVHASMLRLEGADAVISLGVSNDVTDMVKAHQQITALSERMQAVLENVENGVAAAEADNFDDGFLFGNSRFYALHGYTREQYEAEVSVAADMVHPDDRQRVMASVAAMNRIGMSTTLEHRIIRRDGEVRWLRTNVSVRGFADVERPVQFVVYTDITGEQEKETPFTKAKQPRRQRPEEA